MKFLNYINEFNKDEIEKANKSSRSRGAVGSSPLGFRWVLNNVDKSRSILDFGAGRDASQTLALLDAGFMNVTAYEFGRNLKKWHDPHALNRTYQVVMANNVLNVQSSDSMLTGTLNQINSTMGPGSILICNFPQSPRYYEGFTVEDMYNKLKTFFSSIERVGGEAKYPLWKCTK
jgi:hypothetical protein